MGPLAESDLNRDWRFPPAEPVLMPLKYLSDALSHLEI